jgi:tetratricopeptide (TPR) repeat protein
MNATFRPHAAIILSLVTVLSATAAHAAELDHDQALVALGYPEEKARFEAAVRLGDIGTNEDVQYLMARLRDEKENVRNQAEQAIQRIWGRSGNSAIDAMFNRGVREMFERNFARAISTFTEIIKAKPDFAEAWNKRATLYFITREYNRSLADCDQVIKLNPQHFGALAGYGQIYLELDQPERALDYFQKALNVNPNLVVVVNTMNKIERMLKGRREKSV